MYSLEEMWRFLEVQIEHGGFVENKLKALDEAENDCSSSEEGTEIEGLSSQH